LSTFVETVLAPQRLRGTHFIMGVPEEQDGGPELTEEERRQKNIAARQAERLALKKPDAEREKKLEAKDKERAMQGILADFVLIYPVESEELLREKAKEALKRGGLSAVAGATGLGGIEHHLKKQLAELNKRQEWRANMILKFRQAGLMTQLSRSRDGECMYLKVWATLDRLIVEAGRTEIEMLVTQEVARSLSLATAPTPSFNLRNIPGLYLLLWLFCDKGKEAEEMRSYRDFDEDEIEIFERKKGRLFSSLERQRLVYSIVEGAEEVGGAQQDLDEMVARKAITSFVWPHSYEKEELWFRWGAMDEVGPIQGRRLRSTIPDLFRTMMWFLLLFFYIISIGMDARTFDLTCAITLGLLMASAMVAGMFKQPLHQVRDYFGESMAFYFAWMEHYETYLIYLAILALVAIAAGASEVFPMREGLETAADGRLVPVDDTRLVNSAWAKLIYCFIVAAWTTVYMESWKRRNAVLAYIWDVQDFEEEEAPRPEFLANFANGRWKAVGREEETGCLSSITKNIKMEEGYGFFTEDGRFVAIDQERGAQVCDEKKKYFPEEQRTKIKMYFAVPQLLLMTGLMIIGQLAILVFKMLVQVNVYLRTHPFWGGGFGQQIPNLLSVIWIQVMNNLYVTLATALNDLENYRTETEYQDQRILKVMVFTFINSYITLFYIAFIKANGVAVPFSEGISEDGRPYRDLCGYLPGESTEAPWDGSPDAPGDVTCGVRQGCFRFANTVPECTATSAVGAACCNFNATTLAESGCNFVFVKRDCSFDLRQMMVNYTLLKTVYEGILQVAVPVALTMYSQYKLEKQMKQHAKKQTMTVAVDQPETSPEVNPFLTGINIQLPLSPVSPRLGTSSPASPDNGRSPPALDAAAPSSVKLPSPEAATAESSMPPPAPESPRLTPRPTSPAAPGMTPPPSPPEGEAALKAAHEETVAKGEETEGESEADEAHWKDEVMAMTTPPPSPPSASVVPVAVKNDRRRAKRIAQRELAGMPPEEQRLAFHKSIELELTQEVFPGTFAEFLTKVVQFGYVSMFSAAFPIAAISSAVGNFIEIRLDAIKVLQSRRRRYEGAEDIGSWQDVLVLMSWIALPINVSLFVFTSWTFRKYVLVPSIATSDSCSPAVPYETIGDSAGIWPNFILQANGSINGSMSEAKATLSPRARFYGTDDSFTIKCAQNINDCWAAVGGVEWLPAQQYLVTEAMPRPYGTDELKEAVCNRGSKMYNQLHCEMCEGWSNEVLFWQMLVLFLVEHVLLVLKVFLAFIIPDSPQWVRDATARADFLRSVKHEVKRLNMDEDSPRLDATMKVEQTKAEIAALKKRLNESTDGQRSTSASAALGPATSGGFV
jgi:hypothetical protein